MLKFFEHSLSKSLEHERKFVIPAEFSRDLEFRLRHHPAFFREINIPIRVTSCYFDTANLDFYFDNVDGVGRRLKVRVRSYTVPDEKTEALPDLLADPRLEYKIKIGTERTKRAYKCSHAVK